jgi:hypothetical protein
MHPNNSKWALVLALLTTLSSWAAETGPRWELRNERVTLALGQAERGGVISLRPKDGDELIAAQKSPLLFALTLSKKATTPGERFTLTSREAAKFAAEVHHEGDLQRATLQYAGFGTWPIQVTCTATVTATDPMVRWRIAVQLPADLVLETVRFPIITLKAPLSAETTDDALVLGSTKGGIVRRPSTQKPGTAYTIGQPGNMAAQFGCYYAGPTGFFTAALDAKGYPKNLSATRVAAGVEFSWQQSMFASGTVTQDYDLALTTFSGTAGAPADWRDAADLYKAWALQQPWCATTYDRRTDLPPWLQQGPAMVRFGRDWLADPAQIDRWMAEFYQKHFPGVPLITAFWGWEKHGNWVTPDYFPVFPSDEEFKRLVARLRAQGAHAFPWPSGYHWTLTFRKQGDGGFAWDDRTRFATVARAHAVQTRAGQPYLRTPSWLAGGDTACLCGGDPWTHRWWNEDICVPLAERGCELIQVDQVVGGNFPPCYDPAHPHAPGPGRWQTEAFARQLQTMHAAMRRIQPDAVVCFEEPNEWFNHLVGLQDYRDCETPHEWASVFNYLYHEFLPPFQSNPRGDDLVMLAHCLVDGQMPHLVPSARDLSEPLPLNGGFEPRGQQRPALTGWEPVSSYQGVDWTGVATSDQTEKHGGEASLRLENAQPSDIVQISQNVAISTAARDPRKRYRLSGWLKTDHMAKPNAIMFGLFGPGMKSLGQGGRLPFPAAGTGWQLATTDFTIPPEADTLRIMVHVTGPARAWVDDLALEEIGPDGHASPARFPANSLPAQLMHRWVTLYHGEGRPWLQFGRLLHPPRLTCATTVYPALSRKAEKFVRTERTMPAVLHNAFRSPAGIEAVVLANTTREMQTVALEWHGQKISLTLQPAEARIVK